MPTDDFVALVRRMRAAQKRYFRDRTPSTLSESKDYERRVDAALDATDAAPDLFPPPEAAP